MTLELNQPAPDFELPDLDGRLHRLSELRGRIVIVNFWSCECPHAERTDKAILAMLATWGAEVELLPVAANRNESPAAVRQVAKAHRLPTVLIDAAHAVADLYAAQTTPHIFVIDRGGFLRYRGAVDDVVFRQKTPTRFYLDEAVKALLAGRPPALAESPAYGCTIVREI